ncbi:2-amino-4-hydroxy-6-hydroxymethyldihydropteridine diphosphokinase [Halomonas sp. TD01]|uniref:2-amino-4-hydroxy-6- hydroxymethyldihydropteridine diphosphokinase n=1 Tax=Halomonas sp. TD01 TaxID=999141 RepID=UPI000214EFC8|nr:2-amino-4-hydroxy-6-hydroxymethyldihydropteridine diphosphokinase [Halomonas sp. TD01]EGP19196.1 2-amino-4-hydroxy-6-hydroxymethyldihydropteridine pyrophosphokinase [Halomonas sp. TD01]CAH1042310.1 2-amino-4-hydroxy-6-hydroxymethyldihydropteridinepyrophosphokinase (EC [Halomonas sp. TD01]
MSLAYIGLGSNLDDPEGHVRQALRELDGLPLCQLVAHSSLYATRPIGPQDQPDFINAVAALETKLSPLALLDQLQGLEQRHRRQRLRHWGPRTLDLDLLLYNQDTIMRPRLRVPHPHMHERAFVLAPLEELVSAAQLEPIVLYQQSLAEWLKHLEQNGIQRLSDPGVTTTATV